MRREENERASANAYIRINKRILLCLLPFSLNESIRKSTSPRLTPKKDVVMDAKENKRAKILK